MTWIATAAPQTGRRGQDLRHVFRNFWDRAATFHRVPGRLDQPASFGITTRRMPIASRDVITLTTNGPETHPLPNLEMLDESQITLEPLCGIDTLFVPQLGILEAI
jgi:hypothetical protein